MQFLNKDFFQIIRMFIPSSETDLKFVKSFSCSWWFGVFDNVKFNSFGKWSAFTNGNNISGINISETWGHMGGDVLNFGLILIKFTQNWNFA